MRFEKPGILDRITLNRREGFSAVRHPRRVAEIDEAFVWQSFVQSTIDS